MSFSPNVRRAAMIAALLAPVAIASLLAQGSTTPAPATPPAPTSVLGPTPAPQRVPTPAAATDQPYAPQAILPGGIVVPIYPAGSPLLNAERVKEPEVYNMTSGVPGRIASIVNIHNPSVEIHTVGGGMNTGAAVILAAGGGHNTLNVGTEGADFVPFFYNYGVNTVILRNRLRRDGYNPQTDAVQDALQAIRLVRAHAGKLGIDPRKIGIMGFSAGAELAAPAAIQFEEFDRNNSEASDALAGVSSRPDFVGIIYPGPTPFTRDPETVIPRNVPPSFIMCAGTGDFIHALWADQYFSAMLRFGAPNLEMHIYGNGHHPGSGSTGGMTDRDGTPMGSWHLRFVEWFRDLGFLQKPGVETRAARDVEEFVKQPPRRPRGGGRQGAGRPPEQRPGAAQP